MVKRAIAQESCFFTSNIATAQKVKLVVADCIQKHMLQTERIINVYLFD